MFFILFLIPASLLFSVPAMAMQANGCPDFEKPDVVVKQLVITPSFNDTLNLADIRKMAIEQGQKIASSSHEVPVGITAASLKLDSRYQVRISVNPSDKMACAQISEFDLNFGFDDTVVYLARELPYRSCSYQVVMEHEMKHVKMDKVFVGSYSPYIPEMLEKAIQEIGVIRASSPEVAEKRISAAVTQYMADLGKNFSQVRSTMQAKIDTEDEYARLGKSCNGELSRIISATK